MGFSLDTKKELHTACLILQYKIEILGEIYFMNAIEYLKLIGQIIQYLKATSLTKSGDATIEQLYHTFIRITEQDKDIEDYTPEDIENLKEIIEEKRKQSEWLQRQEEWQLNKEEVERSRKESKRSFRISIISLIIAGISLFFDTPSFVDNPSESTGTKGIEIVKILEHYNGEPHQIEAAKELEKDILETAPELLDKERTWIKQWRKQLTEP